MCIFIKMILILHLSLFNLISFMNCTLCYEFLPAGSSSVRQLPPLITGVQPGSRGAFPLGLTHASNYVRHRVALIGSVTYINRGLKLSIYNLKCCFIINLNYLNRKCKIGTLLY